MGVYIRGMEMPKSCEKCIHSAWSNFYQIYVCNAVRKNEPVLFDGKQTKSTACVRSARADNCPLAPVPPHGRLIDADAFLALINGSTILSDFLKCIINPLIRGEPTVIEAEEDET